MSTTSADAAGADVDASPSLLSSWRPVVALGVVALLVGGLFAYLFLAAYHAPRAHALTIAVAGSPATVKAIQEASTGAYGDQYDVVSVPDQRTGVMMLKKREAFGFLFTQDKAKLWVFDFAGANGPQVNDVVAGAFRPSDQSIKYGTVNLVHAANGDESGMSLFFTVFACVVAGFVLGLLLTIGPRVGAVVLGVVQLVSAAVIGTVSVLLIAGVFGALPGSVMAAVLLSLLVLAVSTVTVALGRLWGLRGVGVAALVVVVLGVVTSATLWPQPYLPGAIRPLAEILPPGLAGSAVIGHAYFQNDRLTAGLVGLVLWSVVAVLVWVLVDRRSRRPAPVVVDDHEDSPAEA